ncbi:MAG: hypothetical protein ABWZ77_06295 [Naasia sp.]
MPANTRRRRRPDARLVLGAVLVVGSVAGVVGLVSSLDRTVVVYAAARSLAVGQQVTTDDLVLADVRLGSTEAEYLRAEALPEDGAVVVRAIAEGELVPRAALGQAEEVDVTSVVVASSGELAEGVVAGARVDVWAAAQVEMGRFGPPRVLVAGAGVARTIETAAFGGSGETAVEIVVPRDDVAAVLDAVAGDAAISLIPTDRALGASR